MTEPLVFERNKRGRKLINFLKNRLWRQKWVNEGWEFVSVKDDLLPAMEVLIFTNTSERFKKLKCMVHEDRPDVITCNNTPNNVRVLSRLLEGYSPNPLIEIVK